MLAERVTNNGASWLSNPVTVKGRTMSTGDSTASTAGRSVECHVCGKMFSTKASCNRHYRVVHERQARYSCRQPECGYRTDSHFNLMRHERKHGCQFQGSKLAPDYVPRTASRRSGAGSAQANANRTQAARAADATREGRDHTTFNAGDDNSMNAPPPATAMVRHVSGAGASGQVMPGLVPMPGGGYMSAVSYPPPYASMQRQGLMQAPPPTPGLPFGMVHPGAAPQPRQPMMMVMAPMSAAPIAQQQQRQQLGPAMMTMLPPNGPSLSSGIPASARGVGPLQASPYVSMQYAQYAYASAAQYHQQQQQQQQRQLSAASHEGHQQQPRRLSETQHPSQRQEPSGPSAWVSSSSPAQYHANNGTSANTVRPGATSTTVQKSATVTSRASAEHGAASMRWAQAQAGYSTGIALAAQPRWMSSAHTPSSPAVSVPTIWRPVASASSSTDTVSGHETATDGTSPVPQTAT